MARNAQAETAVGELLTGCNRFSKPSRTSRGAESELCEAIALAHIVADFFLLRAGLSRGLLVSLLRLDMILLPVKKKPFALPYFISFNLHVLVISAFCLALLAGWVYFWCSSGPVITAQSVGGLMAFLHDGGLTRLQL